MTGPAQIDQQPITTLAGFSGSSLLSRRLLASEPSGMIRVEGVAVDVAFITSAVDLVFVGENCIPQLRLEGSLDSLKVLDPSSMPYDIGMIMLPEQETEQVVADYPFTTEQLKLLVERGLYLDGFAPPPTWTNARFVVEREVDLTVLEPLEDGQPPIVIADLSNLRFFTMGYAESKYELAGEFPDLRGALIDSRAITGTEPLGVEFDQGIEASELTQFSFGTESSSLENPKLDAVVIPDLEELISTDLKAPRALRNLRASTQAGSSRAQRLRRALIDPELAKTEDLYTLTTAAPAVSASASSQQTAEAIENMDDSAFEGFDLGDFSFGDTPVEVVAAAQDSDSDARHRAAEPEPEAVTDSADLLVNMDESEKEPDPGDDSPEARARRARIARRNALRAQQAHAAAEAMSAESSMVADTKDSQLPSSGASTKKADDPQLGG